MVLAVWVMLAVAGSFGCAIRKRANRSAQDDRLGGWARSGFFPFGMLRVGMTERKARHEEKQLPNGNDGKKGDGKCHTGVSPLRITETRA